MLTPLLDGGQAGTLTGLGVATFSHGVATMKYRDYIQSGKWRETRARFLVSKSHDGKCYACDEPYVKGFHVHHRSYKRLGKENIGLDLLLICPTCHDKIHNELSDFTKLWWAAKKLRKANLKHRAKQQQRGI